jgi:hypothetical protein
MLPSQLNTNEVKDSAGAEVEFETLVQEARRKVYKKVTELPYLPHRITFQHLETGSGINLRRRSNIRIDKSSVSGVDATKVVTTSLSLTLDAPIGALTTDSEMIEVIANMLSLSATTGAGTTVLFNGTGNGAVALRTGGL